MNQIKVGDVDSFQHFILVSKAGGKGAPLLRRTDDVRREGDRIIVENLHTGCQESVCKDEPIIMVHT